VGARGAELAGSRVDVSHLAEDVHDRVEAAILGRVARGRRKRGREALKGFVQRADERVAGGAVPDMEASMPQAPADRVAGDNVHAQAMPITTADAVDAAIVVAGQPASPPEQKEASHPVRTVVAKKRNRVEETREVESV
jgi:hypothetical protein